MAAFRLLVNPVFPAASFCSCDQYCPLETFLLQQYLQTRCGIARAGVDGIDQGLAPCGSFLAADANQLPLFGHDFQFVKLNGCESQHLTGAWMTNGFRSEAAIRPGRSEEHTSDLQYLMRNSYAV